MTSFASENGPSVTVAAFAPALLCTRNPFAPKLTPSVCSSQPSFMASSTSLPIAAISACVGARLVGSCVKMLMNRMVYPPGFSWLFIHTSNGGVADRHDIWTFLQAERGVGTGRQLGARGFAQYSRAIMDPRKAKKNAPPGP